MKTKSILVSAAAVAALFAGSLSSASAQPYWGPRHYSPRMSYTEFFRQLRACQRHERVHRQLGREHAHEHYDGLESRGDHRDLHGALGEAHDAYHYDNPRADFCDRMIRSARYRNPYRHWNRTYGNYGQGYGVGPGAYSDRYGYGDHSAPHDH